MDEVIRDIRVHPVTIEVARRASIEGELATVGVTVAFEDLLIAATTALHLGLAVATSNIRHFHVIPGLAVVLL